MAWAACERAIQSWTLPSAPGPRTVLAGPSPVFGPPLLVLGLPSARPRPRTDLPRCCGNSGNQRSPRSTTDVFGERPPASAHPHRVGRYAVTGIAHADGSHRSIHRLFL